MVGLDKKYYKKTKQIVHIVALKQILIKANLTNIKAAQINFFFLLTTDQMTVMLKVHRSHRSHEGHFGCSEQLFQ